MMFKTRVYCDHVEMTQTTVEITIVNGIYNQVLFLFFFFLIDSGLFPIHLNPSLSKESFIKDFQ